MCSAKIRATRATEIGEAVGGHLMAGGVGKMVTLTARHHQGQPLKPLLVALADGFRRLLGGRAWAGESESDYARRVERWETGPRGLVAGKPRPVRQVGERERLGVAGIIRSVEVTYGGNGWHPHLHVVVLFEEEPPLLELAAMMHRWETVWLAWMGRHGYPPSAEHGVAWSPVTAGQEAGDYVAKVQDGSGHLGHEVARGDMKLGRLGNITPFGLLEYIAVTGDADALHVWHEYEAATKGHRAITWSKGLRERLLPEEVEKTDEEIAEEETGGEPVAAFGDEAWSVIVETDDLYGLVLRAVETGWDAVVGVLEPYGVRPDRPTVSSAD